MALTRLGANQSINLATNTTGTLGVANGGTGLTSGTTDQFLKFTGSTTLASAADNSGNFLQVKTAYGGSNVTINTTSTQNPISSSFYAAITPTTVGNKFIIYGCCDINYSNAGTYHDVGICYSTDGGSTYVTTNMGGKPAKGYFTGVTRLEGTIEFTTGELVTASSNEHRISFNGMSGNGACDFFANGRSSLIVMEVKP